MKHGGRVAISDILARKEFPPDLQRDMSLYVGCISGASMVAEYEKWLKDAGFIGLSSLGSIARLFLQHTDIRASDIMIVDKKNDLNLYKEDTRKSEKDRQTASSACCSSETKPVSVQETSSSTCCSTSNGIGQDVAKKVAQIDFNEWVGKKRPLPSSTAVH